MTYQALLKVVGRTSKHPLWKITFASVLTGRKIASLSAMIESSEGQIDERVKAEKDKLKQENDDLRNEIEQLVHQLNKLEGRTASDPSGPIFAEKKSILNEAKKPELPSPVTTVQPSKEKEPTKPKEAKKEAKSKTSGGGDRPVDISRLDFRVGRILSAKKHPDADGLYVEDVDLGEEKPRTVVSGLVKFVPLEEMQNRLALLLCNLKPAKMRGVLSEAMVMCASTPEKVEILVPPSDAQPGDRVICEGFSGEPDGQLNPKKKIFEEVAPDLKTDGDGVFVYKGQPLVITGKGGFFKAPTLKNVQVK